MTTACCQRNAKDRFKKLVWAMFWVGLEGGGNGKAGLRIKFDIPSLLKDDQFASDNRLPVRCRCVAASLCCHPGRLLGVTGR